ncbi:MULTISPECIES: cell division protein ZapA [Clostridiaceae]|uniref:Cell division protein ZapA n=1 Tax=Clostridium facile TaxID=2763035 RepID=A0ABR7IT46_9CLOT|nr:MULTISPECIES: cell division protein ZapA [Clostridiaceae]MBC5788263.1 cell division protein ZapA [Clostridium facile]PWN00741.1 MAG: cell division protein ZapA [Massilioclostridium sp.]
MEYNRVEVFIGGKRYVLRTQDDPEYMKELARKLDKRLEDVFSVDRLISLPDAAILVALDILDERVKSSSNIDNIRMQIKNYVDEAAESQRQLEYCQRKLDEYQQTIEKLQTELEIYTLRDKIDQNHTKPL